MSNDKEIKSLSDIKGAIQEKKAAEAAEAAVAASSQAAQDTSSTAATDKAGTGEGVLAVAVPEPLRYEPKRDQFGRAYATGKRKNAVARVWIKPGAGHIKVNHKDLDTYFGRPVLQMIVRQPFKLTQNDGQFDVYATVTGGGLSGQAGAMKHGLSKALFFYDPTLRPALKTAGFLTRDDRVVERKKYGKRKARRSFQFSKR